MNFTLIATLLLAAPTPPAPPVAETTEAPPGMFVGPVAIELAQVRIEKRVIIRVPRRRVLMSSAMADIVRQSSPNGYKQKKMGKCMPMSDILGVQRFGDRYLDLVTKDRRQIRARLEKKCQALNFYSGFYMEKSKDGKICADRDILHSRTGAKCEIDRFRLLIPQ